MKTMDKAIFQFDSTEYTLEDVKGFTRSVCEHLANKDEDNVTKFDLETDSLEDILNDELLDTTICYFRVFI